LVYSEQLGIELELEKEFLFPLIKGGHSKAFHISVPKLLIVFPYKDGYIVSFNTLKNAVPLTADYLGRNRIFLEARESGKFKGEYWFQFGRNQAIEVIKNPKIFTPDIAPSPRFSLDEFGQFMFTGGASGGYGIIPNEKVSFHFLLGILNSKIANWYIKLTSTQMRGGWYSFEARFIKSIPFPSILSSKPLEEAVQNQLDQNGENKELTSLIDQLVYALYGLTEEEIRVVEQINDRLQKT
jgi:hypothetical protein